MYKFVDEYAECPDISFRAIYILDNSLWTHVNRASNADVFKVVASLDSKAKVSYLVLIARNKDVRYFDVPMDNAQWGKVGQGFTNWEDNLVDSRGQKVTLAKQIIEIASLAVFSDDIAIIDTEMNI